MNSLSVVLAADSATTVEYYGDNGPERRYFKGANKIFQLSDRHPIGLMIYHSASLLGVPWEVVIKEFRRELDNKSFNSVKGFADEFLAFIQENQRFFPDDVRRNAFVKGVFSRAIGKFLEISRSAGEETKPASEVVSDFLGMQLDLTKVPLDHDELDDLWNVCEDEIIECIELLKELLGELSAYERAQVGRKAFDLYVSQHESDDGYTGLVFAGFGDHSVFPELVTISGCKFLGSKLVISGEKIEKVTHEIPAVMSAFAQTSMTDTFALGLSSEVFAHLQRIFVEEFKLLADQMNVKNGVSRDEVISILRERLDSSKDKLFSYTESDHSLPLRRVLGVLPVDEMAELAETLINLQSLKEKVTKPSETVGGPVDVAAITRAEGLVWIKRKHYFSPELNSRFFSRRGS